MDVLFQSEDYRVTLTATGDGKNRIDIEGKPVYMPSIVTAYPRDLIMTALRVRGPEWMTDEIARDEQPNYVQRGLRHHLLTYVTEDRLNRSRILDFGCGSGASTAIMARMFPSAEIVGTEMEPSFLDLARARAAHYGAADRVSFLVGDGGAPDCGTFDVIVLSAVVEHMLPAERSATLPALWRLLRPGGTMVVFDTPHRWVPIETHTTSPDHASDARASRLI